MNRPNPPLPTLDQLLHQAAQLMAAGPLPEAIAAHQRLLAQEPALPDSWYNLGYLQHRARNFEAALLAYEQALLHRVEGAEEVHLNRAVILAEHVARPEQARAELEIALALQPRYLPAWLNLGNLLEQMGEREAAQAAYQQALALEPGQPLALARMANLQTAPSADEPLIARLRQRLAQTPAQAPLSAADEADLGFGLGKLLDGAGLYDQAFEAYRAANLASVRSAGPKAPRYEPSAHEKLVSELIVAYPLPQAPAEAPQPPATPSAHQPPDRPRIFICGLFRSGSSLAEQILGAHPQVVCGGELDLLPALIRQAGGPLAAAGTAHGAQALAEMRRRYQADTAALFPGAATLTDKRMDNFLYLGLIRQLFPAAKIVHTRRHPLDNGLAVYFLHLSHSMPWAQELHHIGHWIGQAQRLMRHWRALYGQALFELDYDALVAAPEPQIRALLAHCELPWDDACLQFHRAPLRVQTPSAWQVRQPVYASSSGRWRHYATHLAPLREALAAADATFRADL